MPVRRKASWIARTARWAKEKPEAVVLAALLALILWLAQQVWTDVDSLKRGQAEMGGKVDYIYDHCSD